MVEKNLMLAQALSTISLVISDGIVKLLVVWKIVSVVFIHCGFLNVFIYKL